MLKMEKTAFAWLGALGLSLLFTLQAPAAWGQTASDVVCSGCVEGSDIQDGGVAGVDIRDGTITRDDIAVGGVGTAEIEDDSVPAEDLSNEAGVAFLNTSDRPTRFPVNNSWRVMESLEVTAPSSGLVTCIAAGQAEWNVAYLQVGLEAGWDSNKLLRFTPASYNRVSDDAGPSSAHDISITTMHTFNVAAGTAVYSLKARCLGCKTGEQMEYGLNSASCMFFPTRY